MRAVLNYVFTGVLSNARRGLKERSWIKRSKILDELELFRVKRSSVCTYSFYAQIALLSLSDARILSSHL